METHNTVKNKNSVAYYNEHDPFAAAWLRELIKAGLIALGDVDERSIEDVTPNDVAHYTQVHWFAGIGGWSYALRLAGWPDDKPVWTGSPPCQPFSTSGKGKGFADERHLWPAFFWHIKQCQPATIFGEQVGSPKGLAWFDVVSADLESENYAVGAFDLCAAGAGAFHIRQRLTSWPTPRAKESGKYQYDKGDRAKPRPTLAGAADMATWATPNASDAKNRVSNPQMAQRRVATGKQVGVEVQAHLASWATPKASDLKTTGQQGSKSQQHDALKKNLRGQVLEVSGQMLNGFPVLTEKQGQLNPAFSLWLMGFPEEWASCADQATQLSRK